MRQDLVVLVNVSDDHTTLSIPVTMTASRHRDHRRSRITQLLEFAKVALPSRGPLPIMDISERRRNSLSEVLKRS